MTNQEIEAIEKVLGIALPSFYRDAMLNYPFEKDSFAEEFLLADSKSYIIEMNSIPNLVDDKNVFFIGSDGGEMQFFIEPNSNSSMVYKYSVESKRYKVIATQWSDYLAWVQHELELLAKDEMLQNAIRANKKWWQFWI